MRQFEEQTECSECAECGSPKCHCTQDTETQMALDAIISAYNGAAGAWHTQDTETDESHAVKAAKSRLSHAYQKGYSRRTRGHDCEVLLATKALRRAQEKLALVEKAIIADCDQAEAAGARALESARRGNLTLALNQAGEACRREAGWGDDATWSPLLKAIKAARRLQQEQKEAYHGA